MQKPTLQDEPAPANSGPTSTMRSNVEHATSNKVETCATTSIASRNEQDSRRRLARHHAGEGARAQLLEQQHPLNLLSMRAGSRRGVHASHRQRAHDASFS